MTNYSLFLSFFRHNSCIIDVECQNIIILNEYKLQFLLISPLNTLDIDEGNFDKNFLRSKMLFFTVF